MSTMLFGHLFPERKELETRTVTLRKPLIQSGQVILPVDEYGFIDAYCIEPECDCRRVVLEVGGRHAQSHLATISHYFDPPGEKNPLPQQTFLDPSFPQSKAAAELLDLFIKVVLPDKAYQDRLLRRYQEVKAAVADPNHSCHRIIEKWAEGRAFMLDERPRASTSRSGIVPPPPRRGKRKWR
jgi:hypothetical protein